MTTDLALRQTLAITVPEEISMIRDQWVESKVQELERARTALNQLRESEATHTRIKRVEARVTLLRKVVRVLQAGFIPIPRFQSDKLILDLEELPLKVITRVNEVVAGKVFDELRLVEGRLSESRRGPYGRRAARDPLIVGVVRVGAVTERRSPWNGAPQREVVVAPGREEHFLVAWWRPEDEVDQDMF